MKKLILILLLCVQLVGARVVKISSYEKFFKVVNDYTLAVAYFYKKNPELKIQLKQMKYIFHELSKEIDDVTFMYIDLDSKKNYSLIDKYGIVEVPMFLLFKEGSI